MPISLTALLLDEGPALEQHLIAHLISTCDVCCAYQPARWSALCRVHAPLARSILDPDYTLHVQRQITHDEAYVARLVALLAVRSRIAAGHVWIAAQTDPARQAQGAAKLETLVATCMPEWANQSDDEVQVRMRLIQQRIALWHARQESIKSAGAQLLVALEGALVEAQQGCP